MLQTPEDFQKEIQHQMRPIHAPFLEAEYIKGGSWDFQAWLAPMQTEMSGLTITEADKSVSHSLRIVRREDLRRFPGSDKWELEEDACNSGS